MQFGHLGIALAIASIDPRPETFAVVTAAQFLPNADSLLIRVGWAAPEFHGTWSHSLPFCAAVGALATVLFGPWLGLLALASIVLHVVADLPTDTGFYPAWGLALVGTAAASLAEAVNYRLVDWAAESPKVSALKGGKAVRWSIDAFSRAPFWTTAIVIFSPIPDSAVRILAPLSRYPLSKFLAAVAFGRFPRLLLIAGFGVLVDMPTWLLLAGTVAFVVLTVARRLLPAE